MCFNYALIKNAEELQKRFDAILAEFYRPFYVAPAFAHPSLPVITADNRKMFDFFRWGLIPFWVKERGKAEQISKGTINARSESLLEKPSFKHLVKGKRCIVPADGFYEWQEVGKKRYPYFISPENGRTMAFAGLWDEWIDPADGSCYRSFAVITRKATPFMAEIHNVKKRMPLILNEELEEPWLAGELALKEVEKIIHSEPTILLKAHTVKKEITNVIHSDNPAIIEPHSYKTLEDDNNWLFK